MPLTVTRPTCRPCSWTIDDDIPSRLTPLFLYESNAVNSIRDENGALGSDPAFTGNVRRWNDRSGNGFDLTDAGNFSAQQNITYDNTLVRPDSFVEGIETSGNPDVPNGTARRLTHNLATPITGQDFEMYLLGGFTEATPTNLNCFFNTGEVPVTGSMQVAYFDNELFMINRGGTSLLLGPYTPGPHLYRFRYTAATTTMVATVDNAITYTGTDFQARVDRIEMFTNRNRNVVANATIQYFTMFNDLLDEKESKDFSKWIMCAWNVAST